MKRFLLLVAVVLFAPSFIHAESPTMCTMQYDPVCGTKDGAYKTYGNGCVLGAEGATYQHEGECTAEELSGSSGSSTYVPPAHCTAWFDGCNQCGRGENGEAYCTLKACMGEPRAGYCTAYGDTETEREQVEETKEDPLVEATTSEETSEDPGFLFRIWNSILSWFQGLF